MEKLKAVFQSLLTLLLAIRQTYYGKVGIYFPSADFRKDYGRASDLVALLRLLKLLVRLNLLYFLGQKFHLCFGQVALILKLLDSQR